MRTFIFALEWFLEGLMTHDPFWSGEYKPKHTSK